MRRSNGRQGLRCSQGESGVQRFNGQRMMAGRRAGRRGLEFLLLSSSLLEDALLNLSSLEGSIQLLLVRGQAPQGGAVTIVFCPDSAGSCSPIVKAA